MSDKKNLLDTLNTRLKRLNKYKANPRVTDILSNIEVTHPLTKNDTSNSSTDNNINSSNNNINNNISNIQSIKIGGVNITKNEDGHMIANLPNNSGYEIQYNLKTKTYKKVKI